MSSPAFAVQDTTLVRANAEQTRFTRLDTFELWGGPKGFTREQYLRRDELMEKEEWSVGDGFVTWVLVPRNDPTTIDNILAHCETYSRSSALASPGAKSPTPVRSYGIACVFTPPKHTGHRYARHMLRLLHYVLAPLEDLPPWPTADWGPIVEVEGLRDSAFSVLYSGIGDKYYASAIQGAGVRAKPGWRRIAPPTRTWSVAAQPESSVDQTGWRWLDTAGVKELEAGATEDMKRRLVEEGDAKKTRLAILPEEGLLKLHCIRDELSAGTLNRSAPRTYGLVLPSTDSSPLPPALTYCFPTEKDAPQTLIVSYVHHPFPFEAVVAAARKEGCTEIEVWDGAGEPWEGEEGMQKKHDNMPCLALYGDLKHEETEWLFCERYAWC